MIPSLPFSTILTSGTSYVFEMQRQGFFSAVSPLSSDDKYRLALVKSLSSYAVVGSVREELIGSVVSVAITPTVAGWTGENFAEYIEYALSLDGETFQTLSITPGSSVGAIADTFAGTGSALESLAGLPKWIVLGMVAYLGIKILPGLMKKS